MNAYYCDHCGSKFRYTHDDRRVCLTDGCPNNPQTDKDDAQKWRDHVASVRARTPQRDGAAT